MTTTTLWQGQAELTCVLRHEETADCTRFEFAAPRGMHIDFLPGQFICLGGLIDNQLKLRAYSIASNPAVRDRVSVAIRRVPGGQVSNWLADHVQPGTRVAALAPAGSFHLSPAHHLDAASPRHIALFSAGCGVTPMVAMSHWLLAHRPDVEIHFIHSARDENNLILDAEIRQLAARHPAFHLHHFLTQPKTEHPCHVGRIDAVSIRELLPAATPVEAYLCGPQPYMDLIADTLRAMGIADQAIHSESFFTPQAPVAESAEAAASYALNVPAFGSQNQIGSTETLLDVLERAGLPIIGACRTGVCGSCRCKVSQGEVHRIQTGPLSPEEQQAGYVLACSTHARSDLTLELG